MSLAIKQLIIGIFAGGLGALVPAYAAQQVLASDVENLEKLVEEHRNKPAHHAAAAELSALRSTIEDYKSFQNLRWDELLRRINRIEQKLDRN